MSSSTTTACRAGVMLVCLVAIPLAALFGTQLPDLAKRLWNRRWDLGALTKLFEGGSLGQPPPGPPVAAAPWKDEASPGGAGTSPNPWRASATESPGKTGLLPASYDVASVPAGKPAEQAATAALWQEFLPQRPRQGGSTSTADDSPAGVPSLGGRPGGGQSLFPHGPGDEATVGGRPRADANGTPTSDASKADLAAAQRLPNSEQIVLIEKQLRELGVAYYALETWGASGQYYRFHARVALRPGANCFRHFESVDADPAQAMADVLGQIEDWRAGQSDRQPRVASVYDRRGQ